MIHVDKASCSTTVIFARLQASTSLARPVYSHQGSKWCKKGSYCQRVITRASTALQAHAILCPETIFSAATVAVLPIYALMIGSPRSRLTRTVLSSSLLLVAASGMYAALLSAWLSRGVLAACSSALQSCNPLPNVRVVAAIFNRAEVTALAWLHLLLLDLFQARAVWQDGLRHAVATPHSLVFCFMMGPVGLLSHLLTKGMTQLWRRRSGHATSGAVSC